MVTTGTGKDIGGRVNLRLPKDLWEWVTERAEKEDRSMNKQVINDLRAVRQLATTKEEQDGAA